MAKSFAPNDGAQPSGRVIRNRSRLKAPPDPDHRLLGDVRGVVRTHDAAGLTKAPRSELVPVETACVEKVWLVMKRF